MSCPRVGHAATVVRLSEGNDRIVIAGGGSARCYGPAEGRTADETIEIFEPRHRRFVPFDSLSGSIEPVSDAVLAPLGDGVVLLADRTRPAVWLVNVARSVVEQFNVDELYESARDAAPLGANETARVVILGELDGRATLFVFDSWGYCGLTSLDLDPLSATMTAMPGERVLIASGLDRLEVSFLGCEGSDQLRPSGTPAILDRSRPAMAVLESDVGVINVLLIGGGVIPTSAGQFTEVFHPSQPFDEGREPPYVANGPRSFHFGCVSVAVPLADGTALVVGCDAATEIYNPRRSLFR